MKKLFSFIFIITLAAFSHPAFAEADLNTGLAALQARDYPTAVANLEPLANDGNMEASYRMCGMYYLAQGVPKNDAEAARFCHQAAEKGHADAMYNLALMYQKGEGVRQDMNEAIRWYTAAAARGHPDARFNLNQIQMANNKVAATPKPIPGVDNPPPAEPTPLLANNVPNPKALELVHNAASNMELRRPAANPAPAAAKPKPVAPVAPTPPPAVAAAPIAPVAPVAPAPPLAATPNAIQQATLLSPPSPPPKPAAAVVAPKAVTPPPTPPVPPAGYLKPPQVSAANVATPLDITKYCLMAAQRGNPDPNCSKELSPAPSAATVRDTVIAAPVPKVEKVALPKPAATEAPPAAAPPAPAAIAAPAKPGAVATTAFAAAAPVSMKPHTLALNQVTMPGGVPTTTALATAALITNTPRLPAGPDTPAAAPQAKPPEKPEHDLKWYTEQANTGDAPAQNNLGVMYRRGLNGAPTNISEAIRWFERAASQGSVNGMLNLASIYKIGEGTNQNLELAYAWYNLAADRLPVSDPKKAKARQNVTEIAPYLSNEQIGDALQYVTELDENIPKMDEPVTLEEEPKAQAAR